MPGVTEREIAQAKQMNLYQYMQLCEPDNFKPEGPGQFRHKGHSSLSFAENGTWTYFKTHATGRTAVDYLIKVEGVPFVEAVRQINRIQGGCIPSFQSVQAPTPPVQPKPPREFRLPQPDPNSYAATAYLRKRCIHPNVLSFCKQKKILYQTSIKNHPNCVFVGRDGEGQAKGGSLRGCGAQQFRRDIPGSRKIYPFYIEAAAETDTVEVYEAPIDAMSPSVGLLLTNALSAADEVIIPMQAQPFSVVGMSQLTDSVFSVQRKINPKLHIMGILLTMTQHTKVSEHYAADVRARYGNKLRVFDTEIPYNVKVQESQAFAAPTILYEPKSSSAKAYVEFTKEVVGHGREEQVYERDEDARDR